MTPADFRALNKSKRLETIRDTLLGEAASIQFKAEHVVDGWGSRADDLYRANVAAAALIDHMIAVGREIAVSNASPGRDPTRALKDLPIWLGQMMAQASAAYCEPPTPYLTDKTDEGKHADSA